MHSTQTDLKRVKQDEREIVRARDETHRTAFDMEQKHSATVCDAFSMGQHDETLAQSPQAYRDPPYRFSSTYASGVPAY